MEKLVQNWRGTRASLAWFLGLPFVNARIALTSKDTGHARAILSRHCARFLRTCGFEVLKDGPPPARGEGCVLSYNEASFADVAAFAYAMWDHVDVAAGADLYGYFPYGRTAARKLGIEMVSRGNRASTDRLVARMVDVVRGGQRLAWGGEGRIHGQDGIGPYKIGGALIAIRAQVPIVPVVFYGGHRAMPFGTLRARSGKIRVRFGTPIPTTGLAEDAARALADQVQAAAAALYEEMKASCAHPRH